MENKKTFKYYFSGKNLVLYKVPEKYWWTINAINTGSDREAYNAIVFIKSNCKPILTIDCYSESN